MKRSIGIATGCLLMTLCLCFGQGNSPLGRAEQIPPSVTAAKLEQMRESGRAQNLEDVDALIEIARNLDARMEKESPFVVSVRTLKDTDEIQKLTRRIRSRVRAD